MLVWDWYYSNHFIIKAIITMLQINNLDVHINHHKILNNISLTLDTNKHGVIFGPSGCGKSTLLNSIAGFRSITSGSITHNDKLLSSNKSELQTHKRSIGMVFQDPSLFPHLTVFENIAFGLKGYSKDDIQKRVSSLLSLVNLTDFENRYPHECSGGQQQRIALARALAPKPSLLLCDEPFSNLDQDTQIQLCHDVKRICDLENTQLLLVTHNIDEASILADYMGVMIDGNLIQWGPFNDVLNHPNSERVAKILGYQNIIPIMVDEKSNILFNNHIIFESITLSNSQNHVDSTQTVSQKPTYLLLKNQHIKLASSGMFPCKILNVRYNGHIYTVTVQINTTILVMHTVEDVTSKDPFCSFSFDSPPLLLTA